MCFIITSYNILKLLFVTQIPFHVFPNASSNYKNYYQPSSFFNFVSIAYCTLYPTISVTYAINLLKEPLSKTYNLSIFSINTFTTQLLHL